MTGAAGQNARVLIVHERYALFGGEDAAVDADIALLRSRGHVVHPWILENSGIGSWGIRRKLALAWKTTWNAHSSRELLAQAERFRPDVVHFHNILPIVSPSALHAAHTAGLPVVITLHNYRLLCPAGTFFRQGRPCEECHQKSLLRGVIHGCYRGSRGQTAVVAFMLTSHRIMGTWSHCVDAFITPTGFLKAKLVQGGFNAARIHVRPNAVGDGTPSLEPSENYILFAGRLSAEKGILTLLDAMTHAPEVPLIVIGQGPLESVVRERASESSGSIRYAGHLDREGTDRVLSRARALIFPSLAYETFGLSLVEALSHGVPVVASRLGVRSEMIRDGDEGLLFEPGNPVDLARQIRRLMTDATLRSSMGRQARKSFEERFSQEHGYQRLMEIYRAAIESARTRRAA